jgi:guanylate kinase
MGDTYIYIAGRGGVGKDTVYREIQRIIEQVIPNTVDFNIPITTRKKRENETDGVDYMFLSDDEFSKLVLENRVASRQDFVLSDGSKVFYGNLFPDQTKNIHIRISTFETIRQEACDLVKEPDSIFVFNIVLPPKKLAERIYNRAVSKNLDMHEVIRRAITDGEDFSLEQFKNLELYLKSNHRQVVMKRIPNTLEPSSTAMSIIYILQAFGIIDVIKNVDRQCLYGLN